MVDCRYARSDILRSGVFVSGERKGLDVTRRSLLKSLDSIYAKALSDALARRGRSGTFSSSLIARQSKANGYTVTPSLAIEDPTTQNAIWQELRDRYEMFQDVAFIVRIFESSSKRSAEIRIDFQDLPPSHLQ